MILSHHRRKTEAFKGRRSLAGPQAEESRGAAGVFMR